MTKKVSKKEEQRRQRNKKYKSYIKSSLKDLQQAIKEKKEEILPLVARVQSFLDKSKSKGVFHRNKVNRLKSKAQKAASLALKEIKST